MQIHLQMRLTSLTILCLLAVSPEPSVKTRTLCLWHAHTGCLRPRTHPADTSAAWRPSPHMVHDLALEPQPHPGALSGAAAGPAGRAVAAPLPPRQPYPTRPTGRISGGGNRKPAIGDTKPNDPAAWGYAARSPMTGKIWRTTPPSPAATSAARPRFSVQTARQIPLGGVEPFSFRPRQNYCLGHCITRGIGLRRQAMIFRLRGAVLLRVETRPSGNLAARVGLKTCSERNPGVPVCAPKAFVRS